MMILERLKI